MNVFSLRSGTSQEYLLSLLPFSIVLEVLSRATKKKIKEIKSTKIGKENIKISLYTNKIIVYIENSKESTKTLIKPIGEYNKSMGYKTSA